MIQVRHLKKVFRRKVTAVDDVSFEIGKGELVGVLGPNGAGKTTIVKCICTLVRPTSGEIVVCGADAATRPRAAVANLSAVLEGNRNVYWRMTVRENLEFFAGLHGVGPRVSRPYADALIDRFGLTEKRNVTARLLSRGMQQKLSVASALVRRTPVLLLDEPTLGLDVETSVELRTHLRDLAAEGRTILVTSHDMHLMQDLCERVIVVNRGRVVADDKVANLLALFRAQAYRLRVEGSVPDALHARFPAARIPEPGIIELEIASGHELYELMDVLRAGDVLISGIDQQEPDLEDVFLRLVRA